MNETGPHLSRPVLAAALLGIALAAGLPYAGILDAPFVFDDVKFIAQNRFLRPGEVGLRDLLGTLDITDRQWDREEFRPNYRPVRFLSYLLDWRISRWWFGEFPPERPPVFFFHLTNVLLHAANAFLVFFLVARLLADLRAAARREGRGGIVEDPGAWTGEVAVPLWTALLFALHPLQTEAVTYVSGRRDVLSTCFFLAATNLWLAGGRERRPSWLLAIPLAALFALGYLSKEMVVTLPAALLLLDVARRVRWTAPRVALLGLLWTEAIAFAALTLGTPGLVQGASGGAGRLAGLWQSILTAPRYILRYLGLAIFPWSQSIDYSYDAIPRSTGLLFPWTTIPAALLALALVALGLRALEARRRTLERGLAGVAILWFVGTLAPVLQIVPAAEAFAERFAYLPLVGFLLLIALLVARIGRWEPLFAHSAAGILCVLALAGTLRRNADWDSPLDLWTAAVRAQPRAARAHLALAHAQKETGRPREAVEGYSRALAIFEERPDVPLHHGFILQALAFRAETRGILGEREPELLDGAVADYRRVLGMEDIDGVAIATSPRHTVLHTNLALILLAQGKASEARAELERVIAIGSPRPLVAGAWYHLGRIALGEGDFETASAALRRAWEFSPDDDPAKDTIAVTLADLLISRKEHRAALDLVREAVRGGARGLGRLNLLVREAQALDRLGDLPASMDLLSRILAEAPTYGAALVSLGRIEMSLGRLDSAEARLVAVPPGDPQYAEATEELRSLRVRKKLARERPEEPRDLSKEAEQVLSALEGKAERHIAAKQWIEARETIVSLLAKARAAGKRDVEARALRELARIDDEAFSKHEDARRYLEASLELRPNDPATARRLADLVLRRFGEKARARQLYETYLAVLPAGETPDARVLVNLATLVEEEDPPAAVGFLERAREAGADPAFVDRMLGYLHARLGNWRRSMEAFTRYFESAPRNDDEARAAAEAFVQKNVVPKLLEED